MHSASVLGTDSKTVDRANLAAPHGSHCLDGLPECRSVVCNNTKEKKKRKEGT